MPAGLAAMQQPPGGSIASSHRRRKHCQQPQASAKTRKVLKNMKGMHTMKHIASARKTIKGFRKMLQAQAMTLTRSACLNDLLGVRLMRCQWHRTEEKKKEAEAAWPSVVAEKEENGGSYARADFLSFYADLAW